MRTRLIALQSINEAEPELKPKLKAELSQILSEALNPVSPQAQARVPVPPELDLDKWIHDPLPEVKEEYVRTTRVYWINGCRWHPGPILAPKRKPNGVKLRRGAAQHQEEALEALEVEEEVDKEEAEEVDGEEEDS